MAKTFRTDYSTVCPRCRMVVNVHTREGMAHTAIHEEQYYAVCTVEYYPTVSNGVHGTRITVHWTCPACEHSHADKYWVVSRQPTLPGFGAE
jgi:hypothetical protein